ncbi:hypothetical protein NEUTE2DRAFT_123092 [Neurospora tetrasperma FGSC 2509]|nr:hypothetical protein NEUTE2DRAFT_123092 [Neurospora tetrasperma FGSC 2509]
MLLIVDNGRQMDTAIRLLPRLTPDKSLPQLSNGPCSVAEKARDLMPRRGVTGRKSGAHLLKLWRTKRTILYNDILTTKRAQERAGTKMGFNPGLAQWTRLLKMAGQCRLEISLSKSMVFIEQRH